MKNFKKLYSVIFCVVLLSVFMSISVSAEKKVTMYSLKGDTISVSASQVSAYKKVGWYDNIDDVRVTLYAKNKTIKVFKADVDKYLKLGWYKSLSEITTTIYSSKGSAKVYNDEVSSYLKSGWSLTPVMLDNISSYPITYTKKSEYSTYTLTVNSFNDYSYYDSGIVKYSYSVDYTEGSYYSSYYIDLAIQCYDSKNTLLTTKSLSVDGEWHDMDLPGNTAWYKIAQPYEDGYKTSGSFTHCRQFKLYGPENKTLLCYDMQLERQMEVGWQFPETIYTLDGRTMEVSPYDIDKWKKVGWYDYYGFNFFKFQTEYDFQVASYNWEGALNVVNSYGFWGTEYEEAHKQKKNYVLDKWRSSIKCPLALGTPTFDNSNYEKKITMDVTNVSYKPVVAYRIKFDCYNVFNEKINTTTAWWEVESTYISSGYSESRNFYIYLSEDVRKIKNIQIYDIVFEDGSMA